MIGRRSTARRLESTVEHEDLPRWDRALAWRARNTSVGTAYAESLLIS